MDVPIRFLPTQTVAPETFLVRQLLGEGACRPTGCCLDRLRMVNPGESFRAGDRT